MMKIKTIQIASDLVTSVIIRAENVTYEVKTDNPCYQEGLRHIGFTDANEGIFWRRLSVWGDVAEIHDRFALHLRDILRQSARMAPIFWESALALFLRRVESTELNWFMYGSGALAVRGIEVTPGDLDIWVDDAEMTGRIFADLLIEPVTQMQNWVADKIGRAYSGCIIEWLSGVHASDKPHEQGSAALSRLERTQWNGFSVPVPPLDLQLAVLEQRGLSERIAKVRSFMARTNRS